MIKEENLQELASEEVKNNSVFKRFLKGIKTIGVISLVSIISGLVGAMGANQLINRQEYISKDYYSIKKPVGLFNSVDISKYQHEKGTNREFEFTKGFLLSQTYTDKAENNSPFDGKADEIKVSRPFKTVYLYRDADYNTHKPEFDKADEILAREEPKYQDFFKD